jgi:hypothetical protein
MDEAMRTHREIQRRHASPIVELPRRPAAQRRPRPRGRLLLLPLFLMAAAGFALALLLPWHHRFVFGREIYVSVRGTEQETWLGAGSVFALALAGLFSLPWPRAGTKIFAVFADVVMLVCMIIDYLDWQIYAASVNPDVPTLGYVGPGFYVGLGATGLLIVTTVLVWRAV